MSSFRTFVDSAGREWSVDVSAGNLMRVKRESGGRVNLFDYRSTVDGRPLLGMLTGDLELLYEVLAFLCEPQAKQAGLSPEDFGRALDAKAFLRAQQALNHEWHDFFLQLRRLDAALAIEKLGKYQAAAVEMIAAKMADATEADQAVILQIRETLNRSFGDSEVSSA